MLTYPPAADLCVSAYQVLVSLFHRRLMGCQSIGFPLACTCVDTSFSALAEFLAFILSDGMIFISIVQHCALLE